MPRKTAVFEGHNELSELFLDARLHPGSRYLLDKVSGWGTGYDWISIIMSDM